MVIKGLCDATDVQAMLHVEVNDVVAQFLEGVPVRLPNRRVRVQELAGTHGYYALQG